jgi:hypothetical protein
MHVLDTRPGQTCSCAVDVLGTIPGDLLRTYSGKSGYTPMNKIIIRCTPKEYVFCTRYIQKQKPSSFYLVSSLFVRKSLMQSGYVYATSNPYRPGRPAMCPTSNGISVLPAAAILLSFFLSSPPPRSQNAKMEFDSAPPPSLSSTGTLGNLNPRP